MALGVIDHDAVARASAGLAVPLVVGVGPCYFPCSCGREQRESGDGQRKKS